MPSNGLSILTHEDLENMINRRNNTCIKIPSIEYYDAEISSDFLKIWWELCLVVKQLDSRSDVEFLAVWSGFKLFEYASKVANSRQKIQQCQEMYDKLQLDKPAVSPLHHSDKSPFPLLRGRTTIERPPRPLTYAWRTNTAYSKNRPCSLRSAPAFMFDQEQYNEDSNKEHDKTDDAESEPDSDYDITGYGRKRTKMDSNQLSDYLNSHGFGLPKILKPTNVYRRPSQVLPRGYKIRPMPKNPSQREKIKGRARLDQEMANMKALAFCEQQAPRVFRTASANMKNRDVQLMEEEMREHMQREVLDLDEEGELDEDNASIVMMPVKHEELIVRINTWMEEVENACKPHQPHQQFRTVQPT